jgi:uncharacterized protein with GYD domain
MCESALLPLTASFPGSSFGRGLAGRPGFERFGMRQERAGLRGGRWCALLGLVYDLWTAVLFRPLPCTRRWSRRGSRRPARDLFVCSRTGGNPMPLYMYQASYTAKSMADQLKDPHDPVEVIGPALEEVGATLVVAGFPFGEYDVVVVYEAPDDVTAASVAMAVAAAGEVRSGKTTRLLSGQEWLDSLRKRRIVTSRKARQPHDGPS